jgi:hypothetical protein
MTEETLIYYETYGITVTSLRVIYTTAVKRQEFFLAGLTGFKMVYKPDLWQFFIGLFFLVIICLGFIQHSFVIYIAIFGFLLLYTLVLKKHVKVIGKNNSLLMKVHGLKTKDLAELLSVISLAEENLNGKVN